MKIISIVLSFLIMSNCFAGDVTFIEKGVPAPYTGHLFTEAKAQSVRRELLEKDQLVIFTKALLENETRHKKIISNQQDQVKILLTQNEKLVKRAQDTESLPMYERIFWTGLGVAVTGFAIYGATLIVK